MFRFFITLVIFISLQADEDLVARQKVVMGTFVTISVDRAHKSSLESAFKLLKNIENSLSSYSHHAIIYQLNHNKSVQLDRYSYEALNLSRNYYQETDGYFDIAIGSITKDLYHFGDHQRVASAQELAKASTNIDGLIFNQEEAIITDSIKIDLGGMGKGYGVDKVDTLFRQERVKRAVIALSGDIRCIGKCYISVHNPFDDTKTLASFFMQNSGVSTSGNYNRYVESKKNNHLINPKTKKSQQNFISLTLISNKLSSATLDAYATAISVMPLQKAYTFLAQLDLAYIILQVDKTLVVSKNINSYVKELKLK